jgi:hypothetical protein
MSISDPVVMPLARELKACFEQELAKVPDPPLNVHLRPGTEVAAYLTQQRDEGCEGLAWVRVVTFGPSSTAFPGQDETPLPKGTSGWAITLEMGALRCAPTPEATEIPTEDEWEAVTEGVMDDAAAMRRAICCFIEARAGRTKWTLPGLWQPFEVSGRLTGGAMTVTVRGPACDCSEAGPAS